MYSCHRKLGHIIDTGCRERGFREVSRGPAVCVGTNSNGDTLPFLGHYGCHCIIQVVEEIPKTCASCESWRKTSLQVHSLCHQEWLTIYCSFFVSSHLFSGQVFRGASVDTGISLVILKFDGNLWPGLVSVLKLENVTVGADTVGAAFKQLHWALQPITDICVKSINQPRLIGNTCLYIHFCNSVIMYLAARFAAVSKWNVQRVALKHTLIRDRDTFLLRWYMHVLQCFHYTAWGTFLPPFIIQISGECR